MPKYLLLVVSCFATIFVYCQPLYTPRNIQDAYHKGTRSLDGKPGKNYWQNTARYDITLTALPPDRTIRGKETIVYVNHSPDTLKNPVFRLTLNVHQAGAIRLNPADSDYLTTGVHIDTYTEDGVAKPWRTSRSPHTWQAVRLSKPLMPNDSVQFTFEWHFDISKQSNREGMIDSTTYFLAYFYPRVAVFDDYNGWDRIDFTDFEEFYNDFNDYKLAVNVPKNYIVWATGDLQNPDELLQSPYRDRLAKSMKSDSVMHIVNVGELAAKNITAQQSVNSWKWKSNTITDITIGLSDHYVWDASSVVVDDATGRRASVQAAYKNSAADFHKSVENANYALGWFSRNWPGVPYPFSKMTVFQGFADMEYPMMVNDNSTGNPSFSRLVQDHEIAHTYFPFYMGINESRYAFMDEGWATTLELLIGRSEMPNERAEAFYKQFRVEGWIQDNSSEEDIPVITPANALTGFAYGNNAYVKPSLGYLAMKDMLGDELFKKCLHEYMSRWHGKHPIPWDFFYTFNDVSKLDLNWFWTNWFFTNNYIDLAVQKVTPGSTGYTIDIQNIGGYVAPFDVKITYTDGTTEAKHFSSSVWKQNQKFTTVDIATAKKIQALVIDGGIFMDANIADNIWKP